MKIWSGHVVFCWRAQYETRVTLISYHARQQNIAALSFGRSLIGKLAAAVRRTRAASFLIKLLPNESAAMFCWRAWYEMRVTFVSYHARQQHLT